MITLRFLQDLGRPVMLLTWIMEEENTGLSEVEFYFTQYFQVQS